MPFQYWKVNITSYPTIDYGKPVEVLNQPILETIHQLDFLNLMLSRPCESVLRSIVRNNTKAIQHSQGYHTVFVLSSTNNASCSEMIGNESRKYGDILQFNNPEGYHFITLSVFHAFQYVQKMKMPIKYIIKSDSDCVINIKALQDRLSQLSAAHRKELYMGNCRFNDTYNYERKELKNYVPSALIKNRVRIPYYATGGCYVISYNVLPRLLISIQHLPFIAHNEDVNVGKGMGIAGIPCSKQRMWIARHGCHSQAECLDYVVMHPKEGMTDVIRFYSYLNNT